MNPSLLRLVATIVIAVLTALASHFPTLAWIQPVIASLGIYGIHAIPSVGQQPRQTA